MINLVTVISERMDKRTLLHKTLVQCDNCKRIRVEANLMTHDDMKGLWCHWCDKCRACEKLYSEANHNPMWAFANDKSYHSFEVERRSK